MSQTTDHGKGFLNTVERLGNKLPDPATIFIILGVAVLSFSWIGQALGWSVIHPGTKTPIAVKSLINGDGIRMILDRMMASFSGFGPLPTVLCIMMGVGVAEGSGLIETLMRRTVSNLRPSLVTLIIVFLGINLNAASDAGFIILPPIAAIIFLSMGRNPLIGIAAAYGAVAAGFNACLILSTIDVLLAGLTETAARLLDPTVTVHPAVNWYFMMFSTLPLTAAGVWITEKLIAPRFPDLNGIEAGTTGGMQELTEAERKALRAAGKGFLVCLVLLFIGIMPEYGVLRNPETGGLIPSTLITGMVFILTIFFLVPGVAYGVSIGKITKDTDIVKLAASGVAGMSGYIVLIFLASQFIAWFSWSNLGMVIAITGADLLKNVGLVGIPLAISFVLLSSAINIFIGSAVAKWALISTVFVPMFMLLDFSPAFTQVIYRIGDSVTNPISPLFPYFPIFVGFLQRYSKNAGMGTAFALMLPFTGIFLLVWIAILIPWILLDLPIGPDAYIFMHR